MDPIRVEQAKKRLAVHMDMALRATRDEAIATLSRAMRVIAVRSASSDANVVPLDYEALANMFDTAAQQARIIHTIYAIEADIVRRMSE